MNLTFAIIKNIYELKYPHYELKYPSYL